MIDFFTLINSVKKHGLQFVMAILCIYLFLSINEERKVYQKELTESRVAYISSLDKLINKVDTTNNRLNSINDRLTAIELELQSK